MIDRYLETSLASFCVDIYIYPCLSEIDVNNLLEEIFQPKATDHLPFNIKQSRSRCQRNVERKSILEREKHHVAKDKDTYFNEVTVDDRAFIEGYGSFHLVSYHN